MTGQTTRRWPLLLLAVVAAYSLINYLYNAVLNPAARVGVDFPANYLSAELVRRGQDPYDQAAFNALAAEYGWGPQRVTPFVYHPLFAWIMIPLTLLPPEQANIAWIGLCQAALWAGVLLTGRALAHSRGQWFAAGGERLWLVGAVLLAANFRPFFTSFQSGRVDAFVFLFVAISFYLLVRNEELWAGLPLGVAILLKITPGLLLLYLAACRRWKAVLAAAVVCGLLAGLSVPLLGWDSNYTFWVGVLPSLLLGPAAVPDPALRTFFDRTVPGYESFNAFIGKLSGFKYHNQALSGLFHGLFDSEYTETIAHSPAAAQLLSRLTMLLILTAVAWAILRRFRAGDDPARRARAFDLGFALVLAATPLLSSVAWEHHFSLLIFSFSLILAYILHGLEPVTSWPVVLSALAYAGLAVGYATTIFDLWRKGVWVFGLYGRAYAVLLLVGVLGYLTLREKADPVLPRLSMALRRPDGQLRWGWLALLLLAPLLLVAFSLRLAFAQGSSLYVDEFTTLLASRYVLQSGLPRTPTGAYYTHGLLFTYLEAAVQAWPFDKVLARLPSVLLGTGTVLALFAVGRRMFSATAALLAAAWLVFAPEAIIWGGRARMYALLQFFVLLTVYCFYKGVVEKRRDGARHLFVLFFLAALYTQLETAMLLPALGLAWLLWQKPRDWLRPAVWIDVALLGVALPLRFYLHQLMILPGLPPPARPRAFFSPGMDVLPGLETLAPFFTDPDRRLVTGLCLFGLVILAASLVRRGWSCLRDEKPAVTFVSLFLLAVFGIMAFVVGETWRHPRYLFLVLPWFLLAAAAAADAGVRWLWAWLQRRWPALRAPGVAGLGPVVLMLLAVVVVGTALAPRAIATSRREDTGYDLAFEFVRQEWQAGDAVATIVPAASLLVLGRCDYLAIENGYGGYLLERDGRKVETWAYIPLLQSPAELDTALVAHPRLWFVADTARLERHFSAEFLARLWDRMALVDFERGVLVFRSGPEVFLPALRRATDVDFNGQLRLTGVDLETTQAQSGQMLRLALHWQAQIRLSQEYTVFVHVDDSSGRTVALADGPVNGGLYPLSRWQPNQPVVDRRAVILPADLVPGYYRLTVGLYRPDGGDRLPVLSGGDSTADQATVAFFWVGERPEPPLPAHSLAASFGGQICLRGYDLETASRGNMVKPGEAVGVTLYWGACGPVAADYHAFVHLLGPDGQIAAQGDAPPLRGQYPTSFWQPGEVLLDPYQVQVPPDAAPGSYPLYIGLYLLSSGERLPVNGGGDGLLLTTLEVQP